MSTRHPLALALLAATSLAACSDDAPATAPEATPPASVAAAAAQTSDTVRTGGTPTTGGGGTSTPADTAAAQNFPASVRVHGILSLAAPGTSTSADTLTAFSPVAGARITLYRNQLVNGKGVSTRIGEVTTGADGTYAFDGVPGGYYVLALNATAERPWGENVIYAIGNRAVVEANMRFWRMPTAPTGGSATPPDSSR